MKRELRKLDEDVAEKVMGLESYIHPNYGKEFRTPTLCAPPYSTELWAAFDVVFRMQTHFECGHFMLRHDPLRKANCWTAHFGDGPTRVDADTACEAICKAALEAVATPRP